MLWNPPAFRSIRAARAKRQECKSMLTLQRNGLRIEAAAIQEQDGTCCVTAEVFRGQRMIRSYYRHLQVPPEAFAQAERDVAEQVASMAAEAE